MNFALAEKEITFWCNPANSWDCAATTLSLCQLNKINFWDSLGCCKHILEHLRRQKGPGRKGASPPCESWPAPPSAGRHKGNVHLIWKAAPGPGRPTRQWAVTAHPAWFRCLWHQTSWCERVSLPLLTQTVQTSASAVCAKAGVPRVSSQACSSTAWWWTSKFETGCYGK